MGLEGVQVRTVRELGVFCQLLCDVGQCEDALSLCSTFMQKSPSVAPFLVDWFHLALNGSAERLRRQTQLLNRQASSLQSAGTELAVGFLREKLVSEVESLCSSVESMVDAVLPHCDEHEDAVLFMVIKADMLRYVVECKGPSATHKDKRKCLGQYESAYSDAQLNLKPHSCVRLRVAVNLGVAQRLMGCGKSDVRILLEGAYFSALRSLKGDADGMDEHLPSILELIARNLSEDFA